MKHLLKSILNLMVLTAALFTFQGTAYAEGAKRVLIMMSSESAMGVSGKVTGTWFEEVATPDYTLREWAMKWSWHHLKVASGPHKRRRVG